MTPESRLAFKSLLAGAPEEVTGIMLRYGQSLTGEPRMVFSFGYVRVNEVGEEDEGVSLEVLPDGTPKLPSDSQDDGRPKLFVSRDALLKVLGCTVDIGEDMTPILRDKEGNVMDPNA